MQPNTTQPKKKRQLSKIGKEKIIHGTVARRNTGKKSDFNFGGKRSIGHRRVKRILKEAILF